MDDLATVREQPPDGPSWSASVLRDVMVRQSMIAASARGESDTLHAEHVFLSFLVLQAGSRESVSSLYSVEDLR